MPFQLTKRKVAAILAGVAVFSIVQLSAATLGGATSDTSRPIRRKWRPGTKGVTVSYHIGYAPDATAPAQSSSTGKGGFNVQSVAVADLNTAAYDSNATVTVVLSDDNGNALATYEGKVADATNALNLKQGSTSPNVEAVKNVAVAVNGKSLPAKA